MLLGLAHHPAVGVIELGAKPLGVAEIGKALIVRMRPEHAAGVLDRAPINLGTRRHLAHERDRTVGIGAIGAIDLLDDVEIGEMVAVEHEVVAAAHFWNLVDRKADRLIGHGRDVEQRDGDNQRIDHRRGQYHQRIGVDQIPRRPRLEFAVDPQHFLLEHDPAVFDAETQFFAPFRQFRLDLGLDLTQLLHQQVELRGHIASFQIHPVITGFTERSPMQPIPEYKNPGKT
ncbi:hypothetical protein GALL_530210 [mine drainage metagenome]|uniref:Uncharacterized protein n=1 Tax=mine drainage metagenome TaxID=410659 RepID=A0A1J5PD40_9ZZZZ